MPLTERPLTDRPARSRKDVLAVAQDRRETDWVASLADEVIAEAERRAPGKPVVVASGLSPSGPIHLGNLREVMVPHLVADEIRRRGIACDAPPVLGRLRPAAPGAGGVDPSWAEHIGKPLTSVPAPPGSPHPNWAEHFKAPMAAALDRLGVEFRGVSQTASTPRAPTPTRSCWPCASGAHRRGPRPVPHEAQARPGPARRGGHGAGHRVTDAAEADRARRARTTAAPRRLLPLQAVLRGLRSATSPR